MGGEASLSGEVLDTARIGRDDGSTTASAFERIAVKVVGATMVGVVAAAAAAAAAGGGGGVVVDDEEQDGAETAGVVVVVVVVVVSVGVEMEGSVCSSLNKVTEG